MSKQKKIDLFMKKLKEYEINKLGGYSTKSDLNKKKKTNRF